VIDISTSSKQSVFDKDRKNRSFKLIYALTFKVIFVTICTIYFALEYTSGKETKWRHGAIFFVVSPKTEIVWGVFWL